MRALCHQLAFWLLLELVLLQARYTGRLLQCSCLCLANESEEEILQGMLLECCTLNSSQASC